MSSFNGTAGTVLEGIKNIFVFINCYNEDLNINKSLMNNG
jgi:hypothetical protein